MNVRATSMSFDYSKAFKELKDFIGKDFEDELKKAEKDISERLIKSAKDIHRFENRTNNLERAIKTSGHIKDTVKYGIRLYVDLDEAPYAKYVIRGHGTWAIDAFIDKAVEMNKAWIFQRLQLALDNAIKIQNRKK